MASIRALAGWLLCLVFSATWPLHAEEADLEIGLPFIRNYTSREYQGYTTTTAVIQDAQDVIYVTTRGYVLECDGVTWKKVPIG